MNNVEMILNPTVYRGSDYEEFKKKTEEMAGITKEIVVRGGDITFLSLCDVPEVQEPGKVVFYVLNEAYLSDFMNNGGKLRCGRVAEEEIGAELLDELRNTTQLMIMVKEEKYLVSDIAVPTLTIRASVSGDNTIHRQNLIRNMHLADAILGKNENIHLVYRETQIGEKADGTPIIAKKIFAGLGGTYRLVPQTILSEAADLIADEAVLGKMEVEAWSVDQRFTDLYLDFPEAAEDFAAMYKIDDTIHPGVFLCTSDVGASSVIVRGVYRKGRSYVITDEVAIKHVGAITPKDILERVNEDVFANIRKLPEALSELIGRSVLDYTKLNLSTEAGASANFSAVSGVIEKTFKKALKNVLPAKRQKALIECMVDEINSSLPYTLYDIAVDFISVPERIEGLDPVTLNEVRKACAKVPFILGDKKTAEKKEEEIVLLPA